jgi:hypothetical protein
MLANRKRIKLLFREGQESVYCACEGGAVEAETREPVSNGQIRIWARMCKWCQVYVICTIITAVPPEFLIKSAHIYGDSVQAWGLQGLSQK